MGRFHNYSFGNILEIARQKPDATRVAGMYAWNQLGRKVIKGQKGIRILAPMIGIRRKKDITKQNQPVLVGFRAAYVFDVSQTESAPLPDLSERVKGEVGEYRERLIDFIIAQGIELEFKESIAPALGMSYGGRIAILPGQAAAEEFSTLVHEFAPRNAPHDGPQNSYHHATAPRHCIPDPRLGGVLLREKPMENRIRWRRLQMADRRGHRRT